MHAMNTGTPLRTLALVMALVGAWTLSADGQQSRLREQVACRIEGTAYVAFGPYDPFQSSDLLAQSQISYRCYEVENQVITSRLTKRPAARRPRAHVEISLSAGQANDYDRRMWGPSGEVSYNLFLDSRFTDVWGDGSRGTKIYSNRLDADNSVHTVVVYGRILAGQSVNGGAYYDYLVVTIDF
jgi:spore coat protein U-like protein